MHTESDAEENSTAEVVPPIVPKAPWRLQHARVVAPWVIDVVFNDGLEGWVDMMQLIHSRDSGVFAALLDRRVFDQVQVKYGALTWPGEIDLAPEPMYESIKEYGSYVPGAWSDEKKDDQSLKRA